jgi:hypothetical protein
MPALAHYRTDFLLKRGVLAVALVALWGLVFFDMLKPHQTLMDRLAPGGMLLMLTGWLWTNLLIAWNGLVRRRALLWAQGGELVFVHRWTMRMPLAQIRRVRLTLVGEPSQLEVESDRRFLRVRSGWAREDLEEVAARVRAATGAREWVATGPVVHSAAATPAG